jgi:hypothetical protein
MELKSPQTNQFFCLTLRKINKEPPQMPWKETKINCHMVAYHHKLQGAMETNYGCRTQQ